MPKSTIKQPQRHNIKAHETRRTSKAARYSNPDQTRAYAAPNRLKRKNSTLTPIEIQLSKILHHKNARDFIAIIGLTIGRAAGVFGAAAAFLVASFLGPIIYSYFGYEYNYLISIFSLVLGFLLGVTTELVLLLIRKS